MGNPFSRAGYDAASLLKPDLVKFNELVSSGLQEIENFRLAATSDVDKILDSIGNVFNATDYELDRMIEAFDKFQANFFFFFPFFIQICVIMVVTFYISFNNRAAKNIQDTELFTFMDYIKKLKYLAWLSLVPLLLFLAVLLTSNQDNTFKNVVFSSLIVWSFVVFVLATNLFELVLEKCRPNSSRKALVSVSLGFGVAVAVALIVSAAYEKHMNVESHKTGAQTEARLQCPSYSLNISNICYNSLNTRLAYANGTYECYLSKASLPVILTAQDLESTAKAGNNFTKLSLWVAAKAVNDYIYRWPDNSFVDGSFWCKNVIRSPVQCVFMNVALGCLQTAPCNTAIDILCSSKPIKLMN